MSRGRTKSEFSWPMIALAIITLVLSSYGLFKLAYDYGNMPAALALVAVGGFDLFAIASGNHAMTLSKDGDSPGIWNLAVIGAAGLSAVLQYTHTQLDGQPWAVGVMMAMFPLATVLLFEGTLRRAHRLNGRRTGRVAEPRAAFELLQWIVYPRATWHGFRLGVADRTLGGDAAFKLGLITVKPADDNYVPPQRLELEMDYGQLVPGYPTATRGLHPRQLGQGGESGGESGGSPADGSGDAARERPEAPTVAELVRRGLQVHGPDESAREAIIRDVLAANPAAKDGTVRREIRKQSSLRSA